MSEKWYQTGGEGEARAGQLREEMQKDRGPRRFWLNVGKSAKVTFLDGAGFFVFEHNLKLDGRWGNFFTCRKDFSECPVCDAGHKPSYVAVFTVIDHSQYEGKDGKVYKNQKKLLVLKSGVLPKVSRKRDQAGGDLTYSLMMFSRDGQKEANTGEDVEFLKKLAKNDVLKLKPAGMSDEEWLKPYDYMQLFAPKTVEELRAVVGEAAPVGSDAHANERTDVRRDDRRDGEAHVGSDTDIESLL